MTRAFSFDVLSAGSLTLTVSACCIQTAAKRAHREVTAALLEDRAATATLEALAATLERSLCMTDFSVLRVEHPELAGGTPCRIMLRRRKDGSVDWSVVDSR